MSPGRRDSGFEIGEKRLAEGHVGLRPGHQAVERRPLLRKLLRRRDPARGGGGKQAEQVGYLLDFMICHLHTLPSRRGHALVSSLELVAQP
jgi:hypothetical protein